MLKQVLWSCQISIQIHVCVWVYVCVSMCVWLCVRTCNSIMNAVLKTELLSADTRCKCVIGFYNILAYFYWNNNSNIVLGRRYDCKLIVVTMHDIRTNTSSVNGFMHTVVAVISLQWWCMMSCMGHIKHSIEATRWNHQQIHVRLICESVQIKFPRCCK